MKDTDLWGKDKVAAPSMMMPGLGMGKSFIDDKGITWTPVKLPISPAAKAMAKKKDYSSTWAALAVAAYFITFWIIYVTEWISINNLFAFFMCNVVLLIYISFKIEDVFNEKVDWELQVSALQYISVWIIVMSLSDLLFEVYWISNLLRIKDIYSAMTINMTLILVVIMINCIVLLSVAGKRVKTKAAVKYTYPATILVASTMMLVFLVSSLVGIQPDIALMENVLPQAFIGAGDMIWEAFNQLYLGAVGGQYGGAEMFTAIFEVLFYSNTTGFMLAIMVIGTFANIFVINMSRSSALQSATTLTVIGIPMIMIISMFLGVIAPPSAFVKIFGAEAIASFVFTFAMLSVYIIFLSIMMVFTQAAEVFQPED